VAEKETRRGGVTAAGSVGARWLRLLASTLRA
jgi:hypothetical protein